MSIVPRISEAEWEFRLANLPAWQPPSGPVFVIAPHPDDETLGAGGLIATLRSRGVDVSVIAVTDGENAYPDTPGLAEVREREQALALEQLGVSGQAIHRLRLTDSGLAACEDRLVRSFVELVPPGAHIVAPWPQDFHPDHEACGRAARKAAMAVGATVSFYFFWAWHRGDERCLEGLSLCTFRLTPEQQSMKRAALACHRSQLHRDDGDPILPENLLAPAYRSYEVFLPA